MDDRKHRIAPTAAFTATPDHRKDPPVSAPAQAAVTPDPAALDAGELALELDELYDGDTHNPYMHDHVTNHKHHRPTPARVDAHERAAWIELVHGIEAAIKHRSG